MHSLTSTPFILTIAAVAFALLIAGIMITISDLKKRHDSEKGLH